MKSYNPDKIEKKWAKRWEKMNLYKAKEKSNAPKAYILDMFPYPSGEGLHVGHVESYTATDIISRYLRMNGKSVLHPQGWDAFGLPAENYAIKTKVHPAVTTKKAISNFTRQLKMMGFSYDWSREINSSDPNYYKWTQWFFLLLYKNGLAYRAEANVNWCESCQTVLANEQVENGVCERCKNEVKQKKMKQWFFRITNFIEPSFARASEGQGQRKTTGLLDGLGKVDWPESTKAAQKNWIGKSEGAEINFPINGSLASKMEVKLPNIKVFTTRLDTIFGCTYCVIAPENSLIEKLKDKIENWDKVNKYRQNSKKKTELMRMEAKEKTGVEIKGIKAINPFNNEEIPVFVADYVLAGYGTGAVMAVPAHDERDFEFAKKYNRWVREVVVPSDKKITGVGAILETKDGQFLFQKRDSNPKINPNKITIFAGALKTKENFYTEEAIKRELFEELKFKFEKSDISPVGIFENHNFPGQFIQVFHIKNIDEKDLLLQEGEEIIKMSLDGAINNKDTAELTKGIIRYFQMFDYLVFDNDGVLINSGNYSGMDSAKAREEMVRWLEKKKLGARKINYKLRDWLISRQRYWGAPIPIIYCDACGEMPVPEKDLPVKLPTDVDFMPTGESPLVKSKKFHNVLCPKCGSKAKRESDTMDTFVCSSWYYFRYADPKNKKEFASKKAMKEWLPVDLYVGGAEHTVLHLLYSRFFTKSLHNLGYIDFDEPFLKLRHQGIVLAEDGRKMSKSLGNVINPDDVVKRVGADCLRMYEMFMGPLEDMKPWSTNSILGILRFLERVYGYLFGGSAQSPFYNEKNRKQWITGEFHGETPKEVEVLLNKTIKKVGEDIENLKFNTAISQLMVLRNSFYSGQQGKIIKKSDFEKFLIILSPFAPFLTEELWQKLGHKKSIFLEKWPEYDPKMIIEDNFELVVQVNGKVRDKMQAAIDILEDEAKKLALGSENVKKWINGGNIKKVIFVKNRLINIII